MGNSAPRSSLLRGGFVGACSASTAVAGHGAAGGGPPSGASFAVLVIGCTTIGAAVASCRGAARPHPALLVAQLCLGQAVGHLALAAAPHHAHASAFTMPMLAAHVAAAIVCALLIGFADHFYRVCVSVLAGLAIVDGLPPQAPARPLRRTTYSKALQPRYLDSGPGTRGPPAVFACS